MSCHESDADAEAAVNQSAIDEFIVGQLKPVDRSDPDGVTLLRANPNETVVSERNIGICGNIAQLTHFIAIDKPVLRDSQAADTLNDEGLLTFRDKIVRKHKLIGARVGDRGIVGETRRRKPAMAGFNYIV
ncbi:MAG: hypothetical protein OSB00_08540, partial [Sphingomonas bacterium]|nr:hypothetical protein [Sphingomonas bacterium]